MTTNHTDVLLEDIDHKFDVVLEIVVGMRDSLQGLARQAALDELGKDVKVVSAAVTNLSQQVHLLEQGLGAKRKHSGAF